MDILNTIIILFSTPLILLLLTFSFLTLRIFAGKSLNNPEYPPVRGTVFSLLFHINSLYDYLATIAAKDSTFRILLPSPKSFIYTTEPRNIEHVLKTSFDKYSKGENSREIMADLFGKGIFLSDGKEWRHQKKLASFEFSTRVLRDFSCCVFRRNAAKLGRVVSGFADEMHPGFDIRSRVRSGIELLGLGGINSEACLRKEAKVVNDFVKKLIVTKRKLLALKGDLNNGKEDILSRFLMESEKDPEKMNDKYLRDVVLNFMIAGKDTSAGTLSWFFYMLCKHPLVQEKVEQEIRDVFSGKLDGVANISNIDDLIENISDATLEKMHYLHATLTETLRLYPAVPVDGRCADVEDILPNGFKVKKGDEVFYAAYAMGRMPYIWGEDAEEFRPERWLNNGVFQPESPFKFVAFHAGPRICLGKDFAYRQMKIISIALVYFFRFKLADETRNLTYKTLVTLHIDGELPLCAILRKIL
ncbi:hypothetical protein TIFTF001_021857 [Ficus carica]|uniref:Cytochrome P450 n=1 Tax=Ficus carica TaxID=3494 RepID=A0AA88AGP0_FICCA|nr:hypothetical protein TIFTF001_021857 [Ficus carica]